MLEEKYVNPLTDFGFKKLFEAAEIAKFSSGERKAYEASLKYYRDLKNVIDTSKEEGLLEGIEKGIEKGIKKRNIEIAKQMKNEGLPTDQIARLTGLSFEEIDRL